MPNKVPIILVVDDEPETRKYIGMNLEARGFAVVAARDGIEAIDLFNHGTFDLVLLDLVMPGPDGFHVCQHLRSVSEVPIIILSAISREADRDRAFRLGANLYLTKPVGVQELLSSVRRALGYADVEAPAQGQSIALVPLPAAVEAVQEEGRVSILRAAHATT